MEYQLTKEDLEKCFKFSVDYHLDKTKLASNRTTGQYRGLGGIIDSFVIGKLIELGVVSILENLSKKEMLLDFEIHGLNKENLSDPDIIGIKERGSKRNPNLFIEIKNISLGDRWIGLTAEQFSTILKNKQVNGNPKKVFLIYASLISKNKEKDGDPLGVFLKSNLDLGYLNKFCEAGDLFVKIMYVIAGDTLKNSGVEFNQGSFLYETEIFKEAGKKTISDIKSGKEIYNEIKLSRQDLPFISRDAHPISKEMGKFSFEGKLKVFHKKNVASKRMYINCLTDVKIKNKVLGSFNLEKGRIYESLYGTVGMNPSLKRNNIWIAQRNLVNVIPLNLNDSLVKIAKEI